ncbi:MAG: hypothetical protein H8K10_13150 [Nitrospira sp.]|nr:hypothetical protein [Nitrospira sp.]
MATTKTMEGTAAVSEIRSQILALRQESSCMRCGGLMVRDFCTDLLTGASTLDCATSRCVQCGDVVDPVIRWNRHLQQVAVAVREMRTSKPALQGQVSVQQQS